MKTPNVKKFDRPVAFAARFTACPANLDYTRFPSHPARARLLCAFARSANASRGHPGAGRRLSQRTTRLRDTNALFSLTTGTRATRPSVLTRSIATQPAAATRPPVTARSISQRQPAMRTTRPNTADLALGLTNTDHGAALQSRPTGASMRSIATHTGALQHGQRLLTRSIPTPPASATRPTVV